MRSIPGGRVDSDEVMRKDAEIRRQKAYCRTTKKPIGSTLLSPTGLRSRFWGRAGGGRPNDAQAGAETKGGTGWPAQGHLTRSDAWSGANFPSSNRKLRAGVPMAVDTRTDYDDRLAVELLILVIQQDASTTISLDGVWDLAERAKMREAVQSVLASQPDRVVLDLSRLTFMDSTGISGLVELAEEAAHLEIELVVIPGSPTVQHVLEICSVSQLLTFIDAE